MRDDGELRCGGRELQRRVRVRGREVGGAERGGEEAVPSAQPDHCRRRGHGVRFTCATEAADAARRMMRYSRVGGTGLGQQAAEVHAVGDRRRGTELILLALSRGNKEDKWRQGSYGHHTPREMD